ncbi:hypothetical protein HPB52_011361 [Rhipicephalus sanguineus]|uniref:Uncharacterized protein n=1 Tax=Rhipicephalus sanguineus TaxID=34632 RepID=A0A9D4PZK0_RHISA|nr:hypothetical protein HPB52_011361 [Rhipicephalus sanguineus]
MPASPPPPPPDHRRHRPRPHKLLLLIMADRSVVTETHADVSLSGHVACNQAAHHPLPHPITAVLTRRPLAVNLDGLPFHQDHHVFLEIQPQRREQPSLFLLNVYNPPCATENASFTPCSAPLQREQ